MYFEIMVQQSSKDLFHFVVKPLILFRLVISIYTYNLQIFA